MGGEGSGRKIDIVKQMIEQRTPIGVTSSGTGLFLPNYSGIQEAALKTSSPLGTGLGLYSSQRLSYPAETIFTSLESGHGFVTGTYGTITEDTTNYVKGSQSLKLTTEGNGSATVMKEINIAAIDLTGKYLKIWVRAGDISNTSQFRIYVSSDNIVAHYISWECVNAFKPNADIQSNNEWIPICLYWSLGTQTGTPNRAAINSIQLRLVDSNSTIVDGWLGGASICAEDTTNGGVVSITFDDGWLSQYNEAKKKMDEYGFAGTAYVIPDLIDTTNYMTLQNIKDLQNLLGWSIGAHHQTNFYGLTSAQVETHILNVKNWMLGNGLTSGIDDFAYPNGSVNSTILPIIQKYFRSARTIESSFVEAYPPPDYTKLKVLSVINSTTTASIATAIDNARTDSAWLILVFHKIVAAPAVTTEYSIANFGTVIDDMAADGIKVKTVSDVLNG